MPEGRRLEGAAGPTDGLGGKWSIVSNFRRSNLAGVTSAPFGLRKPLSSVKVWGVGREHAVKDDDATVKKS